MNLFDYIFVLLTFAWYIFYGLTFVNIIPNVHQYFLIFVFYYEIYVCLLLILYFNPYMNIKLNKVKKQMIFSASLMLLFSIGINKILGNISDHFNFIKDKLAEHIF